MKIRLLIAILLMISPLVNAQVPAFSDLFNDIRLQIDTSVYLASKNTMQLQSTNYLVFKYEKENEICDIKLFPSSQSRIKKVSLLESSDFNVIDSVINYNNLYYSCKVQFHHLTESNFLRFRFRILLDSSAVINEVNLFPTTKTDAQLKTNGEDLTVGEEKIFELISNHPENIKPSGWTTSQDIDYRITTSNGQLFVHMLANSTGTKSVTINLQTYKPYLSDNKLVYNLPPIVNNFSVKSAGLVFLQTDNNDVTLDDKSKTDGIEIQMDNNRLLQLNNMYLIESKEAPGSPLVAELFPRERISNNKVLCLLRLFNYHRKSEGYLYIKDNNTARFITNFNVIPKVSIDHIKIMRNGKDWVEDSNIYPGETFNLRIEGQSLDKAKLRFDELIDLSRDSIVQNENFLEYKLKVPATISKKRCDIYNYTQNTGKYLTIKEYQKAHPFDYIYISYGDKVKRLSDFKGPELYDKTIKDVIISFQPNKIDSIDKFYGKQYLTIETKILGKKDEIIDMATIDDIVVCPGDKSPRYAFYDKSDCKGNEISLNSKISNNTYDLKDWSKIKLTFKNPSDKYSQDAQSKTVEIVLQKHYNFDIDVSFPTGLLIKKMNTSGFGNFGGVSMAVIAQYSFYKKDKINQLKPYKVGAGFLALNAFDFSQNSSGRDMGFVVLGTLNPVNTDRKLSFSVYLGGGYLFSAKTLFWLIGPGINVQF